jgi:hypothetical protein
MTPDDGAGMTVRRLLSLTRQDDAVTKFLDDVAERFLVPFGTVWSPTYGLVEAS